MSLRETLRSIPPLRSFVRKIRKLSGDVTGGFPGSSLYWDERYRAGGTSGTGSYNRLGEFKAEILNSFVRDRHVTSVVEFGSGDGGQLELAEYPRYIGVDVSPTAVETCRMKFREDTAKAFVTLNEAPPGVMGELALSLDVIYHLVEDNVYQAYMRRLFGAASRFVIIYSSNEDKAWSTAHVRHRRFTEWTERQLSNWALVRKIENRYPFDARNPDTTSFADFFIYEHTAQ